MISIYGFVENSSCVFWASICVHVCFCMSSMWKRYDLVSSSRHRPNAYMSVSRIYVCNSESMAVSISILLDFRNLTASKMDIEIIYVCTMGEIERKLTGKFQIFLSLPRTHSHTCKLHIHRLHQIIKIQESLTSSSHMIYFV